MTLPAIKNATLTQVASKGFSDDYDLPATTAPPKWTGSERVFWSEQRAETIGGAADVIVRRSLVVNAKLVVAWAIDDTVTVTYNGVLQTGIIQKIRESSSPAIGGGVIRLELDNA